MAGMSGYEHKGCSSRVDITSCKQAISSMQFPDEYVCAIWDFYVTKSLAEGSSQSVSLENYGWEQTNSKENGLVTLERNLFQAIPDFQCCFVRANAIKDTLTAMSLSGNTICIEHPRGVMKQLFSYRHNENEEVKVESKESRIKCLFRHIRNAFAHGNTYFFDNGNVLLEDKEGATINARLLIPKTVLLKWITVVDKDNMLKYKYRGELNVPPNS